MRAVRETPTSNSFDLLESLGPERCAVSALTRRSIDSTCGPLHSAPAPHAALGIGHSYFAPEDCRP